MVKGSRPAPCWMRNETAAEVALMPATVPLSKTAPLVKELVPFQMATLPADPLPLMLVPPWEIVICPGVVVLMVMLVPATKLVGPYLVPLPSAARICPWVLGAVEVPVPPLPGVKAVVKVKPLKVGVEVVVTDWLMEELPNRNKLLPLPFKVVLLFTAKVLLPKVNVPVPAVRVSPLTVVKLGVAVRVIWVEVPINTLWPPVMDRLEELTVKLPRVLVAVPPWATANCPDVTWLAAMAILTLEEAVIRPLPLTVNCGTWEAVPQLPVLVLTVPRVRLPVLLIVASPLRVLNTGTPLPLACSNWPVVPTAAKTWEVPLP